MKLASNRPFLLGLYGPTGSGKSDCAECLADRYGARLVNADASQTYIGLDIGTSKPESREGYSLLDVVKPTDTMTLGMWLSLARVELAKAFADSQSVIVVGGTGLYLRALFENYDAVTQPPTPGVRADLRLRLATEGLGSLVERLREQAPDIAQATDLKNPNRVLRALERLSSGEAIRELPCLPPFMRLKVGLAPDPQLLDEGLMARVIRMFAQGWTKEVQGLLDQGIPSTAPGMRAIGYREIATSLQEGDNAHLLVDLIYLRTRQYAKRQRTWLRSEPNLVVIEPSTATSETCAAISGMIENMYRGRQRAEE